MVNSSGSFPAFLRRNFKAGRAGLAALAAIVFTSATAWAQMPAYLRTALNQFSPSAPAGWSYTLTTTRNGETVVEQFNPARPPGGQWSLIQLQQRSPTAAELEKYAKSRPTADSGGPQSNFQRADIDPGSLKLVSEDANRAEFLGTFREESSGADKMLGHLNVRLVVSKQSSYVEKCTLELKEPYSPVLGVKMNGLRVETTFSPPESGRPSLPLTQQSHFTGRILLFSTEEKLQVAYADFSPVR